MNVVSVSLLLFALALAGCGGSSGGNDGSGETIQFTVSGNVSYEDRTYGNDGSGTYGFIGTSHKAVRFAMVEVLDSSNNAIATGTTSGAGTYSITASGLSLENMRLRVLAATASGHVPVAVYDLKGHAFAVSKGFTPLSVQSGLDIHISATGVSGAFNILDVFTAAGEFFLEKTGSNPNTIEAYWEAGKTPPYGTTYYSRDSGGIYVLGGSSINGTIGGDTDEFDDDVLLHEYGHFLEHSLGILHSKGGDHWLDSSHFDLRLAWSEGWSDFISGGIRAWMSDTHHPALSTDGQAPSLYLDTEDGSARIAYDFGQVSAHDDAKIRYASNEGAIAKILWDLHSDHGIAPIWSVFSNTLPALLAVAPSTVINLEAFWDGWQANDVVPSEAKPPTIAFIARSVFYQDDDSETHDDQRPVDGVAAHNLFKPAPDGDTDLFPFHADIGTSYRIETFSLTNGADTVVRILWNDRSPLIGEENDNYDNQDYVAASEAGNSDVNDGCTLASRLIFAPPATGDYYVEVSRPASLPAAAGRYGGYRLKISALPSVDPECPDEP